MRLEGDNTNRAYQAPWWLPGGNAQTIWAARFARFHAGVPPVARRFRCLTPDHDFVDMDAFGPPEAESGKPVLVLFHGLEGSSQSHYAQAMALVCAQRGWACVVPHFRGCSGEPNWAARAYHSGDHVEVGWMLAQVAAQFPGCPLLACGISLGGNALLRWVQESGEQATTKVVAVAAVSAPLDLAAAGHAIDHGWNRWVYARMFLSTMVRKARLTHQRYPGLFDLAAVQKATTLRAFDDAFTAPLHGFAGVDDYWQRASAKPHLHAMRIPTLVLNARNDPFVPAASLPRADSVSPLVTLWQPDHGGHCGFPATSRLQRWPGHVLAMPRAVTQWLAQAAGV